MRIEKPSVRWRRDGSSCLLLHAIVHLVLRASQLLSLCVHTGNDCVLQRGPTVATNMLASHLSFLICPYLLFNPSPHPHLLLKASKCTPFPLSPYLSTLHSLACVDLSGYKLCGVEFSLLSSWLHLIEHDVVYVFTTSLHSSHLFREDAL